MSFSGTVEVQRWGQELGHGSCSIRELCVYLTVEPVNDTPYPVKDVEELARE